MNALRFSRLAILVFFASLLWGCGNDNSDPAQEKLNLRVDKTLMEISPHAAIIFTSVQVQKDLNCLAAQETSRLLKKSLGDSPQAEKAKTMLNETTKRYAKICKFYNEIASATDPVFEMIKKDSSTLKRLYGFSIYLPASDENEFASREEEIGLFSSFESCAMFENHARELDIPTRKCSLWSEQKFKSTGG